MVMGWPRLTKDWWSYRRLLASDDPEDENDFDGEGDQLYEMEDQSEKNRDTGSFHEDAEKRSGEGTTTKEEGAGVLTEEELTAFYHDERKLVRKLDVILVPATALLYLSAFLVRLSLPLRSLRQSHPSCVGLSICPPGPGQHG